MNREYVIVSNKHTSLFPGCLLFWGHRTEDEENRSFGGYTSNIDQCERYTYEELVDSRYKFPFYSGENEADFRKHEDIVIKIDELLSLHWLKTMTIVYRP